LIDGLKYLDNKQVCIINFNGNNTMGIVAFSKPFFEHSNQVFPSNNILVYKDSELATRDLSKLEVSFIEFDDNHT